MSHRICLARDPKVSGFPRDRSALWVHHRSDAGRVECERSIEVDAFVSDPRPHIAGVDVVVLLNLVSKIIRPGSRLKYGQFLTDPWNGPPRVSVDTHLFIGQPWRMWFHFGAVDAPFGEPSEKYHTSYRVETDWNFHLENKAPNPCTIDRLRKYCAGVVAFRDGFRFEHPAFRVLEMGETIHAEYQREKALAFDECKTPAQLLKRLGAYAQKVCPFRSLPKDIFSDPSPVFVMTDLGIDRWMRSQFELQISLTNEIAEEFS